LVVYGVLMAKALEPWLLGLGLPPGLVLAAQTVVSTLLILVLAEFLPKALFGLDANRALSLFALPLAVLYVLLWLPMMVFTGLSELLLRLFRVRTRPGQIAFGRVDLDEFLREMSKGDAREQQLEAEVEYLRNTLELSSIKAREIMVPRARIEAIDVEDGVEQLHRRFVDTGMSKLLVYKDRIDNVIGYVHGYELFRHPRSIRAVLRPVSFIPGTMPADEVLQLFIKQRSHVADIEDEHDTPEDVEERLDDGSYLLSGRLEVARIRERFGLDIPESDAYDTLAGFILEHTGDLPEQGQVIEIAPFRLTIVQVAHGRIDLVRLEEPGAER
jgi:CBS domain containing-hemolysin-like protein